MSAPATGNVRRARRWFWVMVLIAVAAMGALYQAVRADPAPAVGIVFLVSALVVLASVAQASRIWVALEGRARLPGVRRRRRSVSREGERASAARPARRANRSVRP